MAAFIEVLPNGDKIVSTRYFPESDNDDVRFCALTKLKINLGATLQGIRINEHVLEDQPNPMYLYTTLSLDHIRIFKDPDRNYSPTIEVDGRNILGNESEDSQTPTLEEDVAYIAAYTYVDDDGNPLGPTYHSNHFTIRVYDSRIVELGPVNRQLIVVRTEDELKSLLVRSERESRRPIERYLNPEPVDEGGTDQEGAYVLVMGNIAYNYVNHITLPAGRNYNGVLDGGWFEFLTTHPGHEPQWVHVRHAIPLEPSTELRQTQPTYKLWVYSCRYYQDMGNYTSNTVIVLNPPKESDSPLSVASIFLTVNSDEPHTSDAYLVDLDYGRRGGHPGPAENKTTFIHLKKLNPEPSPTKYIGISWYGSANAFINCTPMHFGDHDRVFDEDGVTMAFFAAIGKGNTKTLPLLNDLCPNSVFLACSNCSPNYNPLGDDFVI
jgi:hypothetical protein